MNEKPLHDVDFFRWTQEQAAILRTLPRGSNLLDIDNLAEEIEGMGRSEIHVISSLLGQTLMYLIKIAIAPKSPSVSHWFDEAIMFQNHAVLMLSPGIESRLDLQKIWKVSSNGAIRSLQHFSIAIPLIPDLCPLQIEQLLDLQFDPSASVAMITDAAQLFTSHVIR